MLIALLWHSIPLSVKIPWVLTRKWWISIFYTKCKHWFESRQFSQTKIIAKHWSSGGGKIIKLIRSVYINFWWMLKTFNANRQLFNLMQSPISMGKRSCPDTCGVGWTNRKKSYEENIMFIFSSWKIPLSNYLCNFENTSNFFFLPTFNFLLDQLTLPFIIN